MRRDLNQYFLFGLTVIQIFIYESYAYTQTTLNKAILSGVLAKDHSPYIISRSVQVNEADTLTIEAGTKLIFNNGVGLKIKGNFFARGTLKDTITFTAEKKHLGWSGVRFSDSLHRNVHRSIISYCCFEYGKTDSLESENNCGGSIYIDGYNKIEISHCIFRNNKAVHGGAIFSKFSNPVIHHNIFYANRAAYGAALYFQTYINQPALHIYNNTICRNYGEGVFWLNYSDSTRINLINNIDWFNSRILRFDATVSAKFSDIQNGTGQAWFGEGCIDINPLFVDTAASNFNLLVSGSRIKRCSSSPCINAGDPNTFNPDSTISDMGALPCHMLFDNIPLIIFTYKLSNSDPLLVSFKDLSDLKGRSIKEKLWHFGDGVSSDSDDPQYAYHSFGEYKVRLYYKLENGSELEKDTLLTLKQDNDDTDLISIYPNPANKNFCIQINKNTDKIIHYSIIDSKGMIITNGQMRNGFVKIDCNWNSGLYFIKLAKQTSVCTKKLLVNNK